MNPRLRKSVATAFILMFGCLPWATSAQATLGTKPSHVWGGPSSVPNQQAITRMIWAPGIDDGYVPQGVAWADGAVYVSGYRSTDPKIDRGPCRVFKVDPESGNTLGQLDLPDDCGHAGGLAYVGHGVLVASDTRRLYKIDLATAFAPSRSSAAITATVVLRGAVKGSFVDFDGHTLLMGTYDRDPTKSKAHFLPLSALETASDKKVDEATAVHSIALPPEAQGAAFDQDGALWTTASNSRFGQLYKLDAKSGNILTRYEMVIGIEDVAFDDQGQLWSVSEAGSLRWQKWSKTFPVLFRVDTSKLEESH